MKIALSLFLLASWASHVTAFTSPAVSTTTALRRQQQPQYAPSQQQQQRQNNIALFMGWGPDPIWTPATMVSNEAACPSGKTVLLQVQVPAETAADFKVPGQYVQVRLDDETQPLFLAMASAPNADSDVLEFLVKRTDNNDWLTEMANSDNLQVSQVLGSGFPMDENLEGFKYDFPTQNLLLFAAGSGLAPIKSAVESGQLGVQPVAGGRSCRLYYGERSVEDLCCTDRFAAWEQAGIQVVPVLSQPQGDWEGRSGYLQNALEEDGIAVPRNSGALLCGMKGMTEAVKDLLVQAGVFEGRVLFNF